MPTTTGRRQGFALVLTALLALQALAAGPFIPEINCTAFPQDVGVASTDFLGPLLRVTVGNNRFAYRRFSTGPVPPGTTPLVLLMGYGGSMSAWGPTLLHRLAQQREVIIFDNVAQGLTEEVEPTTGPLLPSVLHEATLGFLAALNISRPHIAGWSLGACAALRLAAFNPEQVGKVIAWGGTSPDGRAVVGQLSVMRKLFKPDNSDEEYAEQNFDLGTEAGLRGACWWIAEKRRMPPDECSPEINKRYSAGIVRATRPWDRSSWKALQRCRVPVLLMGGTEDVIVPARAQTQLAERIPGAWLAQFPGAGHGFLWQHMEQALAVMEAFLRGGEPVPGGAAPPVQGAEQGGGPVRPAVAVAAAAVAAAADDSSDGEGAGVRGEL